MPATARELRELCRNTSENNFTSSGRIGPDVFLPAPALIAATARHISRWALGNEENTDQLRKVFQKGINNLYDFCINNPDIGLTMEDIRQLHRFPGPS
jgi:hypothetical protein